ncbi:MAG: right-handed parallel beta-helix repeat-containing protein [Bacteroidales bacterium]|nr:right-handed parallel beta-helix repeat-containing protein [Bacteroidales bacterium]
MQRFLNRGKLIKAKHSLLILFFLPGIFISKAQSQIHCDYEIGSEIATVDKLTFQPGDTLCLMAGQRGPLYLKNIIGTNESPIVIINSGGKAIIDSDLTYGLKFVGCKNIVLSGNGDPNTPYGIFVREVTNGYGLGLESKSTNFEIDHLEISNTKISGIIAKTDPDCTYTAVRDSFTMYNIKIHDNYIHNIGMEGMYIGSSFFLGYYISDCDTILLPHIIDGVEIYNNRVEYTGWDGIQVGSALYNCAIHDNQIYKDSQSEETYQMSGIIINTGSSCNVYNNKIIDGKGTGIFNQGTGNQKFYNNLIVNAGRDYDFYDQETKQQFGILSKFSYNLYSESSFYFYNNTIINPKSDGIRIMDSHAKTNRFINNLIINPGAFEYYEDLGSTSFQPSDAYIHNYLDANNFYSINNILERSSVEQFFSDTLLQDYHLTSQSPAVNWGYDLSNAGITFDLDNNSRPFDDHFDIGAYELQITPISSISNDDNQLEIYPNPIVDLLQLNLHLQKAQTLNIKLINMEGKEVFFLNDISFFKGDNKKHLSIQDLSKGEYILILYNNSDHITQKIQKI